jgi:hypothetical protein
MQPPSGPHTSQYPVDLAYGKSANFLVSFLAAPDWPKDFAAEFVKDLSNRNLRTLVVQVHTSVGHTVEVHPEPGLLEAVQRAGRNAAAE